MILLGLAFVLGGIVFWKVKPVSMTCFILAIGCEIYGMTHLGR
jgi:hypothetical protein